MGTLFSALNIARSGMQIAQVQLDIAGHNIANANKVGFSRQRVELMSRVPLSRPFGQIGRGVAIGQIARIRDPFLDRLFRNQVAGLMNAEILTQFYGQIEDIFLEPTVNGISGRIKQFPQDFEVEEIPAYQPSGKGGHLFLWIEKRDTSAEQLTRHLSSALAISARDIGVDRR